MTEGQAVSPPMLGVTLSKYVHKPYITKNCDTRRWRWHQPTFVHTDTTPVCDGQKCYS